MKTNGNVAGEPVNSPSEKVIRTRSRFPSLSYHFYNTERFGEYNTPFVMDCVEGDKVPIRSGGSVSSYTLKAPLMQSISRKKDFYMIPMEAILPKNWQKFYTNPTIGDDVPDDCGTGVADFWILVHNLMSAAWSSVSTYLADSSHTVALLSTMMFRAVTLGEYFYSAGSLMKSLGCAGNRFGDFKSTTSYMKYDAFVDQLYASWRAAVGHFEFVYDGHTYGVILDESTFGFRRQSEPVVPFRFFIQCMREDLTTRITSCSGTGVATQVNLALDPYFGATPIWTSHFVQAEQPYDLRRLWAYQLTCAQFYTNDHIDDIYSADLFRNMMDYLVFTDSIGNSTVPYFLWNGIRMYYDSMSAKCFADMITSLTTNITSCLKASTGATYPAPFYRHLLGYFSNLFSYRRSLRYVDYFTGSRSRPLAVGDVNVNVNSNLVNIVDVTRNIQRQRFFNAVNRFGRRFEEYIKGLSGITPDVDYHNPLYLAHTSDTVFGVEVENTGVAQQTQGNSVTSRFQTNGNRYQFEFEVDRPCVVLGISYYDMPRAYLFTIDRQLMYMNRFDMFNPYMQFIGDQEVSRQEVGTERGLIPNSAFGYQLRHMEYKQRFDQAAGGFVDDLPGYLFTDRVIGELPTVSIGPHYIRSMNCELDSFYVALTGYSLGHYFHFIVDNDNVCDASRPMAFAPSIL